MLKQLKPNINAFRRHLTWFLLCALTPGLALAFNAGGDEFTTVFQGLISLLQSTPARLGAIIAIIGIGYLTLFQGTLPKAKGIAACVGIAIIFGAGYIASQLGVAVS